MTRKRRESNNEQQLFGGLGSKQMRRKKPINTNLLKQIEPLTENQELLWKHYDLQQNIVAYGTPGTGKTFVVLYKALKEVLDERSPYEKIYIVRSLVPTREIGFLPGPQPLDAKILTPNGWSTMGSIDVGAYVIGRNGKPTKVTDVFTKGNKLVYKITTTDGTQTECCEDHLWFTKTINEDSGSTKTTRQILETLLTEDGNVNHYIPRNEPVEFMESDLVVPPYGFGAMIALNNLELKTKSIPDEYKFSSVDDRIELLRGLMDIDGNVNVDGEAIFKTQSEQLAIDMVELVKSLGGRSGLEQNDDVYSVKVILSENINPFYIPGKSAWVTKYSENTVGIKSIEPVCEKEVKCIRVDNEENLYITDDYIVTHNSHEDKASLYQIPYKNMVKSMFNMQSEEEFEMLYGKLKEQGTISFWSTSFIRGVTLDNAIIVVDEFANLNFHELESIITRVGIDTKICFCGDANQSDLIKANERNGVIDFMKILRKMSSFNIIEFGIEDIVRSSLVKEYLIAKYTDEESQP